MNNVPRNMQYAISYMSIENPVIHMPIRHLYNCRGFSTNQLFFNKQSQFRESSNERKYLLYKGLSNFIPLAGYKNKPNQSQFPKVQNELKIACRKVWPHPKLFRELECSCKVAKDWLLFRSLHARKRFAVRILVT